MVIFLGGCVAVQGNRDQVDKLQKQVQALEDRVRVLESDQEKIPQVLARARAAVAYIRAAYTFVDASGRPLRHVLNDAGEPIADAQGVPLVDLTGVGAIAMTEYCGTAFLVARNGELLTNRHIAEPWWEDKESAPLLAAGLHPVFLRLRAFFEERAEPVPLEVLRVHEEQDIALVRTIGWTPNAEPLSLLPDSERLEAGRRVILIGYPTGLDALLAKLETSEKTKLEIATKGNGYAMTEMLARSNELRPTVTGGFLWEVLPNTLVYDARTAPGGSGGPLLDGHGKVVGVNEAYLPSFQGGNYAVPIRFGRLLLGGGGIQATGPNRETLTQFDGNVSSSGRVKQSPK
jgi:S1-C subfamily serine protease